MAIGKGTWWTPARAKEFSEGKWSRPIVMFLEHRNNSTTGYLHHKVS